MLLSERLCYNDINHVGVVLFGVRIRGRLVGYFGMEIYGKDALFRSLVVIPEARGHGYGSLICNEAKNKLIENGVETAYLLTNTAEKFFLKQGYIEIPRDSVPQAIAKTAEFREFCPDSSTCMKLNLNE